MISIFFHSLKLLIFLCLECDLFHDISAFCMQIPGFVFNPRIFIGLTSFIYYNKKEIFWIYRSFDEETLKKYITKERFKVYREWKEQWGKTTMAYENRMFNYFILFFFNIYIYINI